MSVILDALMFVLQSTLSAMLPLFVVVAIAVAVTNAAAATAIAVICTVSYRP